MTDIVRSCAIVIGSVLSALAFMFFVRRFWLRRRRHQHNDILGIQVAFIGTTYAVILAFVLTGVWGTYQDAENNTEQEANSLLNCFRLAQTLPYESRVKIQSLSRQYATVMIDDEWPAMQHGQFSQRGYDVLGQLWTAVTSARMHSPSEAAGYEHLLSELTNMTEHRRIRQVQCNSAIPGIFWVVMIVGGVLTVFYSCFFDIEQTSMHAFQVAGTTFMIAMILVTIADIDGPYQGVVRIPPSGFRLALNAMGPASAGSPFPAR